MCERKIKFKFKREREKKKYVCVHKKNAKSATSTSYESYKKIICDTISFHFTDTVDRLIIHTRPFFSSLKMKSKKWNWGKKGENLSLFCLLLRDTHEAEIYGHFTSLSHALWQSPHNSKWNIVQFDCFLSSQIVIFFKCLFFIHRPLIVRSIYLVSEWLILSYGWLLGLLLMPMMIIIMMSSRRER